MYGFVKCTKNMLAVDDIKEFSLSELTCMLCYTTGAIKIIKTVRAKVEEMVSRDLITQTSASANTEPVIQIRRFPSLFLK